MNNYYFQSLILICGMTGQNKAFVAEISCWVMTLLRKNVTLAFMWYII